MTGDLTATSGPATPAQDSLEKLALRLQKREDGALEALIERTEKACYRLAYSVLGDAELSRDALQEAYFLVYQRIGQLREPAAIKSWLFRIVNHCCHDIRRRQGKEQQTDFDQREDLQALEASADLAEEVTQQQKIRATFSQLPEIDRTAIALREVCSMSYEEMSRVLNIPLGTVRSRLAKARKRFIDHYKGVPS
jgi:RNA polymerase sigma-70 factor (ECF subfamily)